MKKVLLFLPLILLILLVSCSTLSSNRAPSSVLATQESKLPPKTLTTIEISPTPINPLGELLYYKSLDTSGYNYLFYLPKELPKDQKIFIIIGPDYGQCSTCCDAEAATNNVEYFMNSYLSYAADHNFVLLFPIISNNCDDIRDQWVLHFPDYVFTDPKNSPFYRPDLKINSSIDSLQDSLQKDGYDVNEKVFIFGFSIGGLAANRYTLLQPERVQAFAAGGTAGDISMPQDIINGGAVSWPLGISNIENLVGIPFNQEAYLKIPQFYFLGDNDLENYHLAEQCAAGSDIYCYWQKYWGDDLVTAFTNQCNYLQGLAENITCKKYPGVKHEFTSDMRNDVFNFFDSVRDGK